MSSKIAMELRNKSLFNGDDTAATYSRKIDENKKIDELYSNEWKKTHVSKDTILKQQIEKSESKRLNHKQHPRSI